MEMVSRIAKRSLAVCLPLAAASAFLDWKRLPVSVLIGCGIALVNLKAISWGVRGLLGTQKAPGRLVFFSMFRLALLLVLLIVLMALRLINPIGILAGMTVAFTFIVIEGVKEAAKSKEAPHD